MALHLSVIVALGQMIDLSQMAHRQVADLMAASAYKVIVGADPGVKTVCTVPKAQLLDLPQFYQEVQVPVYGPQADIGEFFADAGIQGIGCRVVAAYGKAVFERFPLTAILPYLHMASFLIVITIIVFSIKKKSVSVNVVLDYFLWYD